MEWDQIETKWTAMTRRVRADLPFAQSDAEARIVRRTTKADGSTPTTKDQTPGAGISGFNAIQLK